MSISTLIDTPEYFSTLNKTYKQQHSVKKYSGVSINTFIDTPEYFLTLNKTYKQQHIGFRTTTMFEYHKYTHGVIIDTPEYFKTHDCLCV